jgi:asparagine synthase (glutamine-hydrolysing)
MLHTGMLGDVVIGSYLQTTENPVNFSALSGATSSRFTKELLNHGFKPEYENLEHHKMMLRGLYGMNMGLMSVYAVTDSYSPFYDIDLFNFCLQLPLKLRAEHKLYTHWITQYYPDAANYIWERTRTKITAKSLRIGSKSMPLQTWLWKLVEKIRFGQPTRNPRYMTPLDYWFATQTDVASQLNNYFNQYLDLIDEAEMRYHIKELYTNGNGKEKVQALSVIAAAKRYVS